MYDLLETLRFKTQRLQTALKHCWIGSGKRSYRLQSPLMFSQDEILCWQLWFWNLWGSAIPTTPWGITLVEELYDCLSHKTRFCLNPHVVCNIIWKLGGSSCAPELLFTTHTYRSHIYICTWDQSYASQKLLNTETLRSSVTTWWVPRTQPLKPVFSSRALNLNGRDTFEDLLQQSVFPCWDTPPNSHKVKGEWFDGAHSFRGFNKWSAVPRP